MQCRSRSHGMTSDKINASTVRVSESLHTTSEVHAHTTCASPCDCAAIAACSTLTATLPLAGKSFGLQLSWTSGPIGSPVGVPWRAGMDAACERSPSIVQATAQNTESMSTCRCLGTTNCRSTTGGCGASPLDTNVTQWESRLVEGDFISNLPTH